MPLSISTTNSINATLVGIVDKIQSNGVDTAPPMRWDAINEEYVNPSALSNPEDAHITLSESASIPGFYYASVAGIDGLTELLRITIYDVDNSVAIGSSNSIPVETFVAPEVVIDLTVTEDRT